MKRTAYLLTLSIMLLLIPLLDSPVAWSQDGYGERASRLGRPAALSSPEPHSAIVMAPLHIRDAPERMVTDATIHLVGALNGEH